MARRDPAAELTHPDIDVVHLHCGFPASRGERGKGVYQPAALLYRQRLHDAGDCATPLGGDLAHDIPPAWCEVRDQFAS